MIDVAGIDYFGSNGSRFNDMKRLLITSILLVTSFCILAEGKPSKNPLMSSDTVVWVGLDYSMVRMIGTTDFNMPDVIFPGMLEKWNQLFLDERVELVAKTLGKRVVTDIGGVTERNKTATSEQIILTPDPKFMVKESHITQQDISAAVRSYRMEKTNGLGLVFIVDRLVRRPLYEPVTDTDSIGRHHGQTGGQTGGEARGAVYVVFFDIATREVISAEREVHPVATGSNFRNFWFGIIKDTDKNLGKYR